MPKYDAATAYDKAGSISHRPGQKKSTEDIRKSIESQTGSGETFDRMLKHFDANGVDLKAAPLTLGPMLQLDPKTEKAIGNQAASKLLTREYCMPFVVSEIWVSQQKGRAR